MVRCLLHQVPELGRPESRRERLSERVRVREHRLSGRRGNLEEALDRPGKTALSENLGPEEGGSSDLGAPRLDERPIRRGSLDGAFEVAELSARASLEPQSL
jgi:hypothetical protein